MSIPYEGEIRVKEDIRRVVTFLQVLAQRWMTDNEQKIKLFWNRPVDFKNDGSPAYWRIRHKDGGEAGTVRVWQGAVTVVDFQFAKRDVVTLRDLIEKELRGEGFTVLSDEADNGNSSQGKQKGRAPLTDEEWEERFLDVEKVLKKKKELRISLEKACARVGIPYSTFRDWRNEMNRRKTTKK